MATPQKGSPLSRRTFTVALVPAGPTPLHSRHLKRIHVAAEILKAAKICAGDALVVRVVDSTAGVESLSLDETVSVGLPPRDEQEKAADLARVVAAVCQPARAKVCSWASLAFVHALGHWCVYRRGAEHGAGC